MLYDLILGANSRLLAGEDFSEREKRQAVETILCRLNQDRPAPQARQPENRAAMYPFLLTPTPGERERGLRLFTGEMPRTRLLCDNAFDLELLRLLALWGRGIDAVEQALEATEQRLVRTCFGHFCATGECVGASLAAMRFYAASRPQDTERQRVMVGRLATFRDGSGRWRGIDVPRHYAIAALLACTAPSADDELVYCAPFARAKLNQRHATAPAASVRRHLYERVLERSMPPVV